MSETILYSDEANQHLEIKPGDWFQLPFGPTVPYQNALKEEYYYQYLGHLPNGQKIYFDFRTSPDNQDLMVTMLLNRAPFQYIEALLTENIAQQIPLETSIFIEGLDENDLNKVSFAFRIGESVYTSKIHEVVDTHQGKSVIAINEWRDNKHSEIITGFPLFPHDLSILQNIDWIINV